MAQPSDKTSRADSGRPRTVAVTGGAGFIGSHVVAALAATPAIADVVVIDNLATGDRSNVPDDPTVDFRELDIAVDDLGAALAGADAVVHLAALPSVPRSIKDPIASHTVNVTGTLRVLEAARHAGVNHVVAASSSSVYGDNPTLPKVESLDVRPKSPYAATKLATEQYTLSWAHAYGFAALALRFFNVFGPHQSADHAYAAVIPSFLRAALDGKPLTVHGDGRQSRDFTYVGTVAAVITQAIVGRIHHAGPVNLAYGTRTDLLEVIELLEKILDQPLERDHVDSRAGDVKHSQADNERLRSLVADVAPVGLEDGLRETVAWFRAGEPRPWTTT